MGIKEIEISGTGKSLIIHEADDKYDSVTGRALTGSWVWDSAPILSQWMATHGILQFDFTGKTVIELGAGTGLPGLTAALLGARRVILTDMDPLIPALNRNVQVNGLEDRVEVTRLVWGSEDELPSSVDLVLMSDVFFDAHEVLEMVETLKRIHDDNNNNKRNVTIWATTEIREWTRECINILEDAGFEIVELFVGLDGFVIYQLIFPSKNK